ncbi:hypothetical protein ElyMa_001509400 [Elysia marginata]|uniref:Uncharacterized protein n=1 Tax=Elysia marginata TaxID=1093978 RepID=A0AAV4J6Q9_9GAST|nr:hypothetical protein ElyMa_001509400 [Elysia marginata]
MRKFRWVGHSLKKPNNNIATQSFMCNPWGKKAELGKEKDMEEMCTEGNIDRKQDGLSLESLSTAEYSTRLRVLLCTSLQIRNPSQSTTLHEPPYTEPISEHYFARASMYGTHLRALLCTSLHVRHQSESTTLHEPPDTAPISEYYFARASMYGTSLRALLCTSLQVQHPSESITLHEPPGTAPV